MRENLLANNFVMTIPIYDQQALSNENAESWLTKYYAVDDIYKF